MGLALAAMAAGTALNYANQRQANAAAQSDEVNNIMQQGQYATQAKSGIDALTRQVANSSPKATAGALTGQLVQSLRANAAGAQNGGTSTNNPNLFGQPVSALPTSGVGSSRFKTDTAADQNQVQTYGTNLAKMMGGIAAPVLQRQEEGIGMQDYATGLQGLQNQSNQTNFINQLRANAASKGNPWLSLAGGLLGGLGTSLSKNSQAGDSVTY